MQVLTKKDRVFWCLNRYWCTYYIVDGYVVGLWWSAIPRLWCPTSDLFMDPKRMNHGIKRIYCVKSQVTTPTKKTEKIGIIFFLFYARFFCMFFLSHRKPWIENEDIQKNILQILEATPKPTKRRPVLQCDGQIDLDSYIEVPPQAWKKTFGFAVVFWLLLCTYYIPYWLSTAPPEADTRTPVLQ